MTISVNYDWQRYYEAAILETDPAQLPRRIAKAQAAIDRRVEELRANQIPEQNPGPDGVAAEEQALADALTGIRILVKEIS